MQEKSKLVLALEQVNTAIALVGGNEWEKHLLSHLVPAKVEIERQLSHYEI
jgi:hypothetical protein